MAGIGLRYCVYAPLTEDDEAGTHVYGAGKRGRKLINANIKINKSEAPLYAEDGIAESVKEFIDGDITTGLDELTNDMRKDWLGNTVETITVGSETEVEELSGKDTDIAPYIGLGFIQPKIIDHVRMYRAVFFPKVQFGEPDENAETKGQSIVWQTPTIVGKIYRRNDGKWIEEITVPSLATATTYIKGKVGLT
jgi:phi13 family phage major tail protein